MDFLDVPGASGAAYRFRRVASLDHLPANAGNVVLVSGAPPRPSYRLAATARSLGQARTWLEQELADAPALEVMIRLNVSRAVRDAEHADIVAAVSPERLRQDLD